MPRNKLCCVQLCQLQISCWIQQWHQWWHPSTCGYNFGEIGAMPTREGSFWSQALIPHATLIIHWTINEDFHCWWSLQVLNVVLGEWTQSKEWNMFHWFISQQASWQMKLAENILLRCFVEGLWRTGLYIGRLSLLGATKLDQIKLSPWRHSWIFSRLA